MGLTTQIFAQACSTCASVTSFTVNLSANPDTTWSVSSNRSGQCCQGSGSDKCVVFYVTVSPRASEIKFVYRNGSANNGVYEINCDPTTASSPGNSQCLGGLTTFCLTYCNPGNANDQYTITTSSGFSAGADITLRNGCSGNLTISGLLESSLTWTSVYPGAVGAYNSYLSCTTGCDTTIVTPQAGAPAYIDYKVCGSRTGCTSGAYCDTQRVYTVAPLLVGHSPSSPIICAGGPNVTLTANPTGGSTPYTYLWSNGSTTQSVSVAAGTYIVAVSDATAGCAAIRDTVVVGSQPAATANAGADAAICSGSTYTLSGSIGGSATSSTWTTSGTGSFSNASSLTATYTPSAADKSAGSVTLTLTTSGPCAAVNDAMVLSINPPATASAGADASICAGSTYTLSGSRGGGATASTWTTSGTGTFNNAALTAATYTPSSSDITAGIVSLIITTNDPAGPCNAASDTMILTITTSPTANAGTDQTVCANNPNLSLSGSITVAGGGIWSSSGTGTFSPNNTTLNATYIPSAADITAASFILTLTTTGNGGCSAVNDAMNVTVTPAPAVNAGIDQSVCANNATVTLNGSVTISSGGTWTSNGTGTFSPNNTTLNAIYIPSAADKTSGSVTLTLTSSGNGTCNAVSDAMVVTITSPPTANAGIDQTVCGNNANVSLSGAVTVATGGSWSSSGTGTFSPNNNTLNATYLPSAADISSANFTLTLTTTGNGGCLSVNDAMTVTVTSSPTVNAGSDQSVCANNSNVTLNGSVTVATGGTWSTSGTGTFSPNNTTLNATYIPSAADKSSGGVTLTLTSSGNGNCNAVSDAMMVTITSAPTANAGTDQSVCGNNANVSLNGSVTVATGGTWSSSGTGTFSPNNTTLNATYIPSAADKTSGSVTITLTSSGNGTCNAVSDAMVVTITSTPTANAGIDQTVCGNNANASLSGAVTVATGGMWMSSGSGSFSPNASTLNATYIPSAADISSGAVNLILITIGNGSCIAVSDTTNITITPAPTSSAGSDQSICLGGSLLLNGSVTVASGGTWSGGTGMYSPNNTTLNATYTPSLAEQSAGSVTLTLTTTGNGTCIAVTDNMLLVITDTITVNAGADQIVCANNATVTLNSSVTGGTTTGLWSSSGTGTFSPSNTTLNGTYIPSVADKAAGTVILTLTSTGNGGCTAVSDAMTITITTAPTVNAGSDQTVCANNATLSLNGSVSIASGGQWTTSGSGTFGNSTNLSTTYNPSAADKTAGLITLTLTSTGNGNCIAVTDQMQITITPAPLANAGTDQFVCINNPNVALSGSVSIATGGQWSTLGSGTFSPNNTALNATYLSSNADTTAGAVMLVLVTTGNGTCAAVKDSMLVSFFSHPTVSAGTDEIICANNASILLNGSSTTGSGTWSTNGTGTFSPNNSALNATYVASNSDTTNGNVVLTLASTNNNGCIAVADQMNVSITDAPLVSAGVDQTVCANNASVSLSGNISVASGGIWTTSGTGNFVNDTSVSTTYIPSASDKTSGSITLTLTSTGNGTCSVVSDQMQVNITPAPLANAGTDISVCINNPNATLAGSVLVATGGQWSTPGSGTFSPNNNALNAIYIPSNADTTAGSIKLVLTTTGNGNCIAVNDTVSVNFSPQPVVSAGSDQTVCANNASVLMNGTSTTGNGVWSSNGTGTFSDSTDLNGTYSPSVQDTGNGSVVLTLTSTNNAGCIAVTDQMNITISDAPVANAGSDQTVCANNALITLNGSFSSPSTGGIWMTSGSGTFSPNDISMNASYTPGNSDTANGNVTIYLTTTGNGLCNAVSDSMTVTYTNAPSVHAGSDGYACLGSPDYSLNGNSSTGSGVWTTLGTGTFSPGNSQLNATYIPGSADIAARSVTLILTSANNVSCNPTSDTVTIFYTDIPVVNAGSNQTVCANNADVLLGATSSTGFGSWTTSGDGTFTPNASALNATYHAGVSDTANGTVTLTFTSAFGCIPVSQNISVTITNAPVVNAGSDQSVCKNNADVSLNGNVFGGATTGTWSSSGSGVFSPHDSLLNATYTPDATDLAAGSVVLVLTSTGNGNCLSVGDSMRINFTPSPIVNAGSDIYICNGSTTAMLNGSVNGGSTTGQWTTSGTGTFSPDANTLNASYQLSSSDTAAGTIQLILTSTSSGNCLDVTDTILVHVTAPPSTFAGSDETVCANNSVLQLNGSVVSSMNTGIWSTNGSGTFIPGDTSLNAVYQPSAADISAGNVTLTLSATNACLTAPDSLMLSITPAPSVNAGPDDFICNGTMLVVLNGTISGGASKGKWTTSGSGYFFPNDSTLNSIYMLSSADSASANFELILSSTDNGNCFTESDTLSVNINPVSITTAGNDTAVCVNTSDVSLSGQVTGGSGTGMWTTSGGGTFSPSDTSLNAVYHPDSTDISSGAITLILTSTFNCQNTSDTMMLTFIPGPAADAGLDHIICAGDTVVLNGSVNAANSIQWVTDGQGYFSSDTSLNATYYPTQGDIATGIFSIALSAAGTCGTTIDHSTVSIVSALTTTAGNDTTICASATLQLNGNTAQGTTAHWATTGAGIFLPDDALLNAVYIPAPSDTISGSVMLILHTFNPCFTVDDTMNVQFISSPTVNAGADQSICAGSNVALNGIVTNSPGLMWTTTGTGSFNPSDTVANATYVPSATDISNGNVMIALATTNVVCGVVRDTLQVNIIPAVSVMAGNDTTVCSLADVQLNASSSGSALNHWSTSGTGTFTPNDSALNAVYHPGATDTVTGVVTLIFNGSNACFSENDSLVVSFMTMPSVEAGVDQSVCAGDSVALNGTASVSSGLQWTTSGTGIFSPDDTSLTASYIPSAADISSGLVEIILMSNTGNCGNSSDTLLVSIAPPMVVMAGNDSSICFGGNIQLDGSATTSTSVHWTTSGSGTFSPNANVLNPVYQPASSDSSVMLVLTATGACFSGSDTMNVSVLTAPTASAGLDLSICAGDSVLLNGTATSGSIQWITEGSGNFVPNDSVLNATYIPGSGEIGAGSATLILISTNVCASATDTMHVSINSVPSASAGNDQALCAGISVTLSGTITNGTNGHWTSNGSGTISPNDSALNATYIPGANDTAGFISIVLTPTSGSCGAIADTLQVTVETKPVAAFAHTPACVNGSISFTDGSTTSIGNINSWSWDFAGSTSSIQNPDITFSSSGNHSVSLIVTTDAGCSDTVVGNVYVNPVPVAMFSSSTACPDSATFSDASTVSSGTIVSWSWSFGDFNSGNAQHPLHVYESSGSYFISLAVTTDSGCVSTFVDSIVVSDCDDDETPDTGNYQRPVLPTAFTPNGDGHNDVLFVRGGPFNDLDLRVYNEWGNEIFHGASQSEGWDGTINGEPQPGGKYIWTLNAISINNQPVKLAGQVMLIRQ